MASVRDAALVLMRLDYSETSQVVVFFTREHGKVRVIGKGIKRGTKTRFATGIDLLDVGELTLNRRDERGAGLAILTEWKQTQSLAGLRDNLARMRAAEYAVEITSHLTQDWDPHVELYDALLLALTELCDAEEPLGPVTAYQMRLLTAIGSLPRFDVCIFCGRTEDLTYFSSHEGGMVCRDCEPGRVEKREVAAGTLKALRSGGPWLQPRGTRIREVFESTTCEEGGHQDSEEAGHVPSGAILEALRREQETPSLVGVFALLNYHIAHLMGREPRLAAKVVPTVQQRIVE